MTRASLQGKGGPTELPSRSQRCSWGLEQDDPTLEVTWQNRWSWWGGEEPVLGKGVGQGGIKAPPLHAQASTDLPSLAFHDPILLMSSFTTPWRILQPKFWKSQGQGTVVWCLLTEGRKTKEAGLVPGRWRVGWGSRLAFRSCPLLSGGCSPRAKECSSLTARPSTPTKSPQSSLALTGGARHKLPAAASPSQSHSQSCAMPGRVRPDPVGCHHHWIAEEMSQPSNPHPHWWREIRQVESLT